MTRPTRSTPTRVRPKCQACGKAMEPLFVKRLHGETHERIPEVYWCAACEMVAKGRTRTRYLPA